MQSASHLSRRRRAALPVLPALLALLLSAVLPAAPARAGGYTPDPVVAELTRAASALASGEPMDTLGDLRPLGRAVDGGVIVGVGEATHGSHQFFARQDRGLRYQDEENGLTARARVAGGGAGRRRGGPPAAPPRGRGARPVVAGVRGAEYDPPHTRTSWEDGRWVG
ncbi:hypothetical protein [Streptomyces albogriseolus]|uniref:hypothetical protein n=1 Tax=Streptomyces albogriseolus TaxID=1887 RepID=UPI0036C504E8